MEFSIAEANSLVKKFELPLGALGFALGATADTNGPNTEWDIKTKFEWYINQLAGRTTGLQPFTGVGAPGGEPFTFNMWGFLNKFLGVAIIAKIYKELGLPYSTTVHNILWPIGVGGTIGGFFDPGDPRAASRPSSSNMSTSNPMLGVYNR